MLLFVWNCFVDYRLLTYGKLLNALSALMTVRPCQKKFCGIDFLYSALEKHVDSALNIAEPDHHW